MAFTSSTNITMMYLLPLLDVMGNLLVWSEKNLPPNFIVFNDKILFAWTGSEGVSVVMKVSLSKVEGDGFDLVELMFYHISH